MTHQSTTDTLRKELTALDGISIVVGTILGSAIFLIPSTIAAGIASTKLIFVLWILGGALSLFGALSLGELGSIFPGTGGLYVYLRNVYGPFPAFLYGWGLLSMIHSGSVAALAIGFSLYFSQLLTLGSAGQKGAAVAVILLLTISNCFGIRFSKLVQNIFATAKFGGVLAMIALLVFRSTKTGLPPGAFQGNASGISWVAIGAALVAILWAFEGWHVVSFAAGEMKRPRIDLPRSLLIGTAIIVCVYLLANASYYLVLTPEEVRSSPAVAATAMGASFGPAARQFISLLILLSVLGAMNGMILTGPRAYYAMAQDGLFFGAFGRLSKRYNTPTIALVAQGVWAALLSCSGTYQQSFTYVIFTAWFFYGLTVAGVIVLRMRRPDLERPYRVPAYPWLPFLFCVASVGIVVGTIAASPKHALLGVGLLFTGVPLFLFFDWKSRRARRHAAETGAA